MTKRVLLISFVFAAGLTAVGCKSKAPEQPGAAAGAATAPTEAPSPRARAGALFKAIQMPEVAPERAELGKRLYHDPNLSVDGTISCASCHSVHEGGDDGLPVSPGVGGVLGPINSPTSLNSHLNFVQFWDGRAATLEEQALGPIENPLEMAFTVEGVLEYLQGEPSYVELFAGAFDDGITRDNLATAIADYERTLATPGGAFDRWLGGDESAMNEEQLRGLQLFMDTGCVACHMGEGLGGTTYQKMGAVQDWFASLDRELTDADMGRFNETGDEADRHFFKAPILRNITLTAPYLHDGSLTDLGETVRVMAQYQLGVTMEQDDVNAVVAFLGTLEGVQPAEVDIAALNLPTPRHLRAEAGEAEAAAE